MAIVLFGSTSSMIVDVEETCARLGVAIRAIVRNVEGEDYALARDLVIAASDVTPEFAASPYLIAIFTPGHRLAAFRDADTRGFRNATTIVDPTSTVARSTRLGEGTYINAGVVVGGATAIGASPSSIAALASAITSRSPISSRSARAPLSPERCASAAAR